MEHILSYVVPILLAIIAFFLKRLIDKIDTVVNDVFELKRQLNLVAFLEKEIEELKKECASLRKSFNQIDKLLYAKNIKIPPAADSEEPA